MREWSTALPKYWAATGQPHRAALIDQLRTLPHFENIRELGSCAGTNIRLFREAFPHAAVEGIDVSEAAVLFAQDKLATDPYVRVVHADILDEAPQWQDEEADVVVSCYALTYIAPEDLPDLLGHIVRSARVGIAFAEPMVGPPARLPIRYDTVEWRHDYSAVLTPILQAAGRPATMSLSTLAAPIDHCDGVLSVSFA